MARETGALTPETLERYRQGFDARPENRIALNAATRGELPEIALNRQVVERLDWTFSHEVPVGGITAQKNAGTCWLFAGLNLLRKTTLRKMKAEKFEFSQNYVVFWDKLEKANRFLEAMIRLADRPLDDRELHHFLKQPIPDGGDWLLMADLVDKYGLVPKSAMGETSNQTNSTYSLEITNYKLRQAAAGLRQRHREGADADRLREFKRELLEDVHRILCILYGEPPTRFDFRFRTKKDAFVLDRGLTPHDFYRKWVGVDLPEYRHLVCSPLESTPYERTYTVGRCRNIEGYPAASSLNLPVETLRKLAQKQLEKKQAVFFDCDVTHGLHRKLGLLDEHLYDYDLLLGTDLDWDRAERMEYGHQSPTHCMVLVGMDVVDGEPSRWKVENSWSEENGEKGLFQMSDGWFREYVHGILVPRKLLGKKLEKLFDQEPIDLPPWHPMA